MNPKGEQNFIDPLATVPTTGCSSGIGRATAKLLSERGYRVIATARRIEDLVGLEVYRRLALDVTDAASVSAAVTEAWSVDVLVNNAGIGMWAPLETVPFAELSKLFETNVLGAVRTVQAFVPGMRKRRRGRVLFVSSASATRVSPLLGGYCASKSALEALARALRFELKEFGVGVTVISMLAVATDFALRRYVEPEAGSPYAGLIAAMKRRLAANRASPASADDVARVIADALSHPEPPFRIYIGEGTKEEVERVSGMEEDAYERMVFDSLAAPSANVRTKA